jgi:hypothetical protein
MTEDQEEQFRAVLETLRTSGITVTEKARIELRSIIEAASSEPYRRWPEFTRTSEYRQSIQNRIIPFLDHFLRIIATYEKTTTIEYFDVHLHTPHFMRLFCDPPDYLYPFDAPIYR